MESAPIGPAPMTMTVSPGATPARVIPWSATASGSASAAWRAVRPRRQSEERRRPDQHVAGEGTVVAVDDEPCPVLALRRLPFQAPAAVAALGRRAADDRLADLPARHAVAESNDGAAELVARHQAWLLGPALEKHVHVGTADPAVVHLHQHLVRTRPGYRSLLDHHLARSPVDGRGHHLGQIGHDGTSPVPAPARIFRLGPRPDTEVTLGQEPISST